jgi:nicotinate-nucleotide adenylyltransferase
MSSLIGILGGTFDPPHRGHLALAKAARHQLGLDRLLWVLTPDPPHKQGQPITPLTQRLAMLKLALEGHPEFELSTVEIDRAGPYYAVDTVEILAHRNPEAGWVYLMGGDSLQNLPNWHRPADLVAALDAIGVMRRPGDGLDLQRLERLLPGLLAKIRWMHVPPVGISAHEIRSRAAAGRGFRRLVSPAVYAYILEHRLYEAE